MNLTDTQRAIAEQCDAIKALLLEKNAAYGNSALEPMRVFSKASTIEQILVRIDDKLSRIARGQAAGEDVELDLIGYLVLLRVARQSARDRMNPVCPGCHAVGEDPCGDGCAYGGVEGEVRTEEEDGA